MRNGQKLDGGRWINGVWVEEGNYQIMEAALRISKRDRPTNVLVVGASGFGKTSLAQVAAAKHRLTYLRMNVPQIRDPEEWYGYREAMQATTVFVRSEFAKVVEKGQAVVLMDEINRVEPWLANTLYPLLDQDRQTVVHNEALAVGPNTTFVATINRGFQYTGTFVIDAALANRFDFVIEVGALPKSVEVHLLRGRTGLAETDASRVVDLMHKMRTAVEGARVMADVSTRTSLKIAGAMAVGKLSLRQAVNTVVINILQADDRKVVADAVSDGLVSYEQAQKRS